MTDLSIAHAGWGPSASDHAAPPVLGRDRLGTGAVRAHFDDESEGLLLKSFVGTGLGILTLGIYRFWFITGLRRELWRRTSVGGTAFEYTGTVWEVFIGFLMMVAILLPLYGMLYAANFFGQTVAGIASLVFFVVFAFFIAFATYRARRYRLSRTLWRGLRFGQTGSGFGYALRAFAWYIFAFVTLGLALPFARAALERYRVNHTWFGDRQFTSNVSGWRMMLPFLGLFMAGVVPLIIAAIVIVGTPSLSSQFSGGPTSGEPSPALIGLLVAGVYWPFIIGFLLWPLYRARELRVNIAAVKLGPVGFRSDFSAWTIYKSYLGWMALSGLALGAISAGAVPIAVAVGGMHNMSIPVIAAFGFFYLLAVWISGALRVWLITAKLFGALAASTVIDGIEHLDAISARRHDGSATGDDFASSYDFGGI